MRIALQRCALPHRGGIASRFNVLGSLQSSRKIVQTFAMDDDIQAQVPINQPSRAQEPPSERADTSNTQQHHRRPPKKKEPRPDHFLALRLSHDPSVISTLTTIQNEILQHSPHLRNSIIDPISAHLTLGVLHLPDDLTKEAAQAALVNAATAAAALEIPCSVTLQGIGNFRNQVVFLELAEEAEGEARPRGGSVGGGRQGVMQLAATVRQHFKDEGLLLQANRSFVPHVTIAKLSKMQPWGRNNNKNNRSNKKYEEQIELSIPLESYSALTSISTRAVELAELQVCAMEGRKPGEYYKVIASASLQL
jgi:2'-5' RNA ligase